MVKIAFHYILQSYSQDSTISLTVSLTAIVNNVVMKLWKELMESSVDIRWDV